MRTTSGQKITSPRLVFWETTARCNLRCIHCRRSDVLDADGSSQKELQTPDALKLIDQIADLGKSILVLSGGEPLLRKDIFKIARHARRRGLRVALASNGTLIDDKTAAEMMRTGIARVAVSLDGAAAASNDALRGRGAYNKALAGITALKRRGVEFQINFTVARKNAGELPEMLRLAVKIDAKALHVFLLVPVGCGASIPRTERLEASEVERRLEWLAERASEGKIEIKATCAPQYHRIIRQKTGNMHGAIGAHAAADNLQPLHQTTKGCLAATGVCFVSHAGDVFPCGYLPVKAGSVLEQDFRAIWKKSKVFEALRMPEKLTGRCGACSFKFVCGGCRARALAEYGDMLAEEPTCLYNPANPAQPAQTQELNA